MVFFLYVSEITKLTMKLKQLQSLIIYLIYFLYFLNIDPRTNDWFLMKSPVPIFSIVGLYLYFVLSWGPRYMRDRKPFKLEKTLIVYNFIQVLLSAWMVYEVSVAWSG